MKKILLHLRGMFCVVFLFIFLSTSFVGVRETICATKGNSVDDIIKVKKGYKPWDKAHWDSLSFIPKFLCIDGEDINKIRKMYEELINTPIKKRIAQRAECLKEVICETVPKDRQKKTIKSYIHDLKVQNRAEVKLLFIKYKLSEAKMIKDEEKREKQSEKLEIRYHKLLKIFFEIEKRFFTLRLDHCKKMKDTWVSQGYKIDEINDVMKFYNKCIKNCDGVITSIQKFLND